MEEFQAVIECTEDPCTYCRQPAQRRVAAHPNGPFPTEDAARTHGWGINHRVYGSSVHRVLVESRTVTNWEETR
ncbi:hypothetical protein [Longimicrobium sp.]|jgi:hypothetical protein|uniref:hypothetical protein n=1 Tax=Longimicrobium sp. TaxID=2029185 RepID=UPI002ED9D215